MLWNSAMMQPGHNWITCYVTELFISVRSVHRARGFVRLSSKQSVGNKRIFSCYLDLDYSVSQKIQTIVFFKVRCGTAVPAKNESIQVLFTSVKIGVKSHGSSCFNASLLIPICFEFYDCAISLPAPTVPGPPPYRKTS